jgi:hypothetical protein
MNAEWAIGSKPATQDSGGIVAAIIGQDMDRELYVPRQRLGLA